MRAVRAAVILIVALGGVARAQFAPQEWSADQDGMNNACYDVAYFQANNLAGGGVVCVNADNTGKLIPAACAATGVSSVTGTAGHVSAAPTTGAVVVDLIATAVTPATYVYATFTVDLDGRLTAASSGTAPVTTVTGTAQRISVTPTTGTPVVDTIGGFYSGAVAAGNQNLSLLSSGQLMLTVAGTAAMSTVTPYQVEVDGSDTSADYLFNKVEGTAGNITVAVDPGSGAVPTSGLVQWLEADSGLNIAGGTWTDQSGAGNSATAKVGSPTLNGSSLNGHPGITLNGTSYFTGTTNPVANGHVREIMFVIKPSGSGAGLFASWHQSAPAWIADGRNGAGFITAWDDGSGASANAASFTYSAGGYVVDYQSTVGSLVALSINNSAKSISGNNVTSDTGTSGFDIGCYYGGSLGLVGDFIGVWVWDHVLSGADRNSEYLYLQTKYGIALGVTGGTEKVQFDLANSGAGAGTCNLCSVQFDTKGREVTYSTPTTTCASNTFMSSVTAGVLTCTQPTFANLSGTAACSQLPALTGGVTSPAGSCATTLNITPTTCGANTFGTSVSSVGALACAQPAFSNLSGSEACSQTPAFTGAVAKSAGSCATTVNFSGLTGSASCAQLPALTGAITSAGGSCATAYAGLPTAAQVMTSAGPTSVPVGDSHFTYDTSTHSFVSSGSNQIGTSTGVAFLNSGAVQTTTIGNGLKLVGFTLSADPLAAPFDYVVTYGGPNFIVDLPPLAFTGANPDFWFRPDSGFNSAVGGPANFATQGQVWDIDTAGTFGTISLNAYVYQCAITTTGGTNDFTFTVTKNGTNTTVAVVASCPGAGTLNTNYTASGSVGFTATDRLGIRGTVTNTGVYSSGALRATVHVRLSP